MNCGEVVSRGWKEEAANREEGEGGKAYEVAVGVPALELLRRVGLALALGGAQVDDEGVAPLFGTGGDAVL